MNDLDHVVVDADAIRRALSMLSLAHGDPLLPSMDFVRTYDEGVGNLIVDVIPGRTIVTAGHGLTVTDRGTVQGYGETEQGGAVDLAFDFVVDGGEVVPVGPYRAGK